MGLRDELAKSTVYLGAAFDMMAHERMRELDAITERSLRKVMNSKKRSGRWVPVRTNPKIHRNDPCPCGSGAKYKKCCIHGELRTATEVKTDS